MNTKVKDFLSSVVIATLIGLLVFLFPCVYMIFELQSYWASFKDINQETSQVLVLCPDKSTQWKPIPKCEESRNGKTNL